MAFFDKKQEVVDIKMTQFGKNLLARGFFKPVYYRFYDDDILYNSECAGFSEEQNDTETRIYDTQRIKTLYASVGIEASFDHEQELIKQGKLETFQEISKKQNPLLKDVMLRYPLENSQINSQEAPRVKIDLFGAKIQSSKNFIKVEGVDLPVPQLNITSSYSLVVDRRSEIDESEIADYLKTSESYIDLTTENIKFLNNSTVRVQRQDLIIDLEELGVDLGLDNFEIEIYKITEAQDSEGSIKQNLELIQDPELLDKFFEVKVDSQVDLRNSVSSDGRKLPRGRK